MYIFYPIAVPSVPPSNVSGSMVNSTAIYITWVPPAVELLNGILRGYLVNVTEIETGRKFQYSTIATEILISSLHPSYIYECIVSTVTIGAGPFSLRITIQTDETGT